MDLRVLAITQWADRGFIRGFREIAVVHMLVEDDALKAAVGEE